MSALLDDIDRRVRSGEIAGLTVWPAAGDSRRNGFFMVSVKRPGRESYSIGYGDTIEEGLAKCLGAPTSINHSNRRSRRNNDDLI